MASVSWGQSCPGLGTPEATVSQLAPMWPGTPGAGPHRAPQGEATRPKACGSQEGPPAPLPKAAVNSTLISAWWDLAPLDTRSHETPTGVVPHPEGDGHCCVCPGEDPGLTTSGCRASIVRAWCVPAAPFSQPPHLLFFPHTRLASRSSPQPSTLPHLALLTPHAALSVLCRYREDRTAQLPGGAGTQGLRHHFLPHRHTLHTPLGGSHHPTPSSLPAHSPANSRGARAHRSAAASSTGP